VPKAALQVLLIFLLALIPAALSALFHPKKPSWEPSALQEGDMKLSDIAQWKDKPLWVDARSRAKFEAGHIPDALLLNEENWDELLPGVFSAWKPQQSVVVYCDDKLCDSSKQVAARLREAGLGPVFILKDGWAAWKAEQP
jgi:rhodanese-related sulfurtransferase